MKHTSKKKLLKLNKSIKKKKLLKSNKSIKKKKLLKIKLPNKRRNLYGGTFSSYTYEELKQQIINILDNQDQSKFNNFILHLKNYFVKKLEKYIELENNLSQNIAKNLHVDYEAKFKVASQVPSQEPQVRDNYIKHIYDENTSEITTAYNDQYNISILQSKINIIKEKINSYPDAQVNTMDNIEKGNVIKNQIKKGIEILDQNFNANSLSNIKKELLEYVLLINTGVYTLSYSPFNMIIVGNPGIGKSYLASQLKNVFFNFQLIATNNYTSVKKPDVIGQYIGHTAPKMYNKLYKGLEGVIFIDEAYSFAGKKNINHGYDIFGVEALDALTDFSSEHIGLLVIIAAGYEYEMDTQFISVNPGLQRRFPITLNLTRYSYHELHNIGLAALKKNIPPFNEATQQAVLHYSTLSYNYVYYLLCTIFEYSLPYVKPEYITNDETHKTTMVNIKKQLNIVYNNGSQNIATPLLAFDQEKKIFNTPYPENVNYFMMLFLLEKCCNIKGGDIFNYQSANITLLSEIVIKTSLLSGIYENFTAESLNKNFNLQANNIILNIIRAYFTTMNADINMPSFEDNAIHMNITDSNNFSRQYINPDNSMNYLKIVQDMKTELKTIIDIDDKSSQRPYNIYTIIQLKEIYTNMNTIH